jgi:uncharacterized membrane protein
MKKTVLIGLFIFSVAANLAVAATVGWHLWQSRSFQERGPATTGASALTREDFRTIRQMWTSEARTKMMEATKRIMEKNLEVLDIIAEHPGDLGPAERKISELQALKGQVDREAFARISKILANLPEEKRETFARFVKTRACMGPGMGTGMSMGRGRGPGSGPRVRGCPVQSQ